jgi:site-specific DNA-methyltransferase (adenine-specific)
VIVDDLAALAAPIDKLDLLPGNPRKGDVDAVAKSLTAFGQRKPIVARRDGTVIAGNHTLQAARQLGWSEIAVVWVDDDDTTAKAFALADNRTAELGSYDDQLLADLIAEVRDADPDLLAASGWSDEATKELLNALAAAEPPPVIQGDPDEVPESAPAKTITGDVWLLGSHRLVCGDSTVPTDVDKLMAGGKADMVYADPPYGMNLDTDYTKMNSNKKYDPVIGDNHQFDAQPVLTAFAYCKEIFLWGADYYVETLNRQYPNLGSWIVWDKYSDDRIGLLDGRFGSAFETCWSKTPHKRDLARVLVKTNYTSKGDETRVHPTQKPVALAEWFLKRWSKEGSIVVDLFGGSGSTLIAAHQTGRIARLMELDPKYCDVICARFQKATGIKPIAEATNNEHDFLEADDGVATGKAA